MSRGSKRLLVFLFLLASPLCLCALLYQVPAVRDRVEWRLVVLQARVRYALSPPEQVVFIPEQTGAVFTPAPPTSATSTQPPTEPIQSLVPTSTPTSLPVATDTPALTPTPPAERVQLAGVIHEYQRWNNCGPATLAMALSYWGWQGDQSLVAPVAKPNKRDNNVMPYEMADFVETQTGLRVVVRAGGEPDLLRRLIAAGFPPVVEKGFEGTNFDGWMGHYELLTGYDDAAGFFTAQDSYLGPNLKVAYDALVSNWRAFNYTYLVVYPAEREAEVWAILGPQADESYNQRFAAQESEGELQALAGRDRYFAAFNQGTALVALQDYAGAAAAYDQAFALYASIPEEQRPWRMLWYQTGPYWAYYYTGRYQDVVDLATKTLRNISEPVLEESDYWRGMARQALGDIPGAIEDYRMALKAHPGFQPAVEQLQALGEEPE